MTDQRQSRMRWRRWPALVGALLLLSVSCAEPEQTTFPLTVSTVDDAEICAVGDGTSERCFPAGALSSPDGVEVEVDDCVTVEVDGDGRTDVTSAVWRGRCSAVPLQLAVTRRERGVTVLVPRCLGSFTSLRVEEDDGTIRWSVARESSTEHPLLEYVTLGEVPPGFVEHDAWSLPDDTTELTVTVRQQNDLPPGTAAFAPADQDESVRVRGEVVPADGDLDEAAGCRAVD